MPMVGDVVFPAGEVDVFLLAKGTEPAYTDLNAVYGILSLYPEWCFNVTEKLLLFTQDIFIPHPGAYRYKIIPWLSVIVVFQPHIFSGSQFPVHGPYSKARQFEPALAGCGIVW